MQPYSRKTWMTCRSGNHLSHAVSSFKVPGGACYQQMQTHPSNLQHSWHDIRRGFISQILGSSRWQEVELQHTHQHRLQESQFYPCTLQRNFSHCSHKIKEAMYKTYVSPIAEYASVAWDPNTHKKHQENQTDPTQQRKVCHQYLWPQIEGHILILSELQCPSLQERRCQSRLAMRFRIRFNLVDINWNDHSLSQCIYYTDMV